MAATLPKLYVAGAINKQSDAEAMDWRARVKDQLWHLFEVVDPMARDYRGVEAENVSEIVRGDLTDIAQCQVIIVRAEAPSWGTAMEVALAANMEQPPFIIGYGAGDRPSPWLVFHCDRLVGSLELAIDAAQHEWLHITGNMPS